MPSRFYRPPTRAIVSVLVWAPHLSISVHSRGLSRLFQVLQGLLRLRSKDFVVAGFQCFFVSSFEGFFVFLSKGSSARFSSISIIWRWLLLFGGFSRGRQTSPDRSSAERLQLRKVLQTGAQDF